MRGAAPATRSARSPSPPRPSVRRAPSPSPVARSTARRTGPAPRQTPRVRGDHGSAARERFKDHETEALEHHRGRQGDVRGLVDGREGLVGDAAEEGHAAGHARLDGVRAAHGDRRRAGGASPRARRAPGRLRHRVARSRSTTRIRDFLIPKLRCRVVRNAAGAADVTQVRTPIGQELGQLFPDHPRNGVPLHAPPGEPRTVEVQHANIGR